MAKVGAVQVNSKSVRQQKCLRGKGIFIATLVTRFVSQLSFC